MPERRLPTSLWLLIVAVTLSLSLAPAAAAANPPTPNPAASADVLAPADPSVAVASILGGPVYAGKTEDAFRICCVAGSCSYLAARECSMLSPYGRVVALMGGAVGGVAGFMGGTLGGLGAYWLFDSTYPKGTTIDPYRNRDTMLMVTAASGAAGALVGGIGTALAIATVDWFIFAPLEPNYERRRARQRADDRPQTAPNASSSIETPY